MRESIQVLQRVFRSAHLRRQRIRQLLAPVSAALDQALFSAVRRADRRASYQVDDARGVFAGKHSELIDDLSAQMQAAAEALAFEQAATLPTRFRRWRGCKSASLSAATPRSWIAT